MTSEEMFRYKIKPGYWMVNVAPLGEKPDWIEQPKTERLNGKIFNRDEKQILNMQYGEKLK